MNKVIHGECLEELKKLPENSVDSIVTDPPYGLSFMGKKWDYDVPSTEIWSECLRVLKPGGYLLAFAGTRTQHRMAVRIEDAGFEIRDMIAWVYGSGFPKSLNIGKAVDKLQGNERVEYEADIAYADSDCWGTPNSNKGSKSTIWQKDGSELGKGGKVLRSKGTSEWEGWGTALKPALEPITVARKPLSEKTVAENALKWGTGGINIDESRVGTEELTYQKVSSMGKTGEFSGQGLTRKNGGLVVTGEQTVTGRFPANLIHDGSEEVRGCFPETVSKWGKQGNTQPDSMFFGKHKDGIAKESENYIGDSGNASRFFKSIIYQAKASKSDRGEGNNHPTVKPIALMEYLVKLVTKQGGTVLDPFAGSGSTLIAAKKNNYNYIGIEMEADYIDIINARLSAYEPNTNPK